VTFIAVRREVDGIDAAGSGSRLGGFGAIGIFVVIVVTVGCGCSRLVIDFVEGTLGNIEQLGTDALFVAKGLHASLSQFHGFGSMVETIVGSVSQNL